MKEMKLDRCFFSELWKLTKGYWFSEERWKARGLLSIVIILNLGIVYMLVLLNQWNNEFYNSLQNYEVDRFLPLVGHFSAIAFTYVAMSVYMLYLLQLLQIHWRSWMTKQYLDKWTRQRTYYKMQILGEKTDNPDQRISEDIRDFVDFTLSILLGGLRQSTTLIAFIFILWDLSGIINIPIGDGGFALHGYMVWICLVYALAGTVLTVKIGKPLVKINFNQQRYEADFRFGLIRYRENSENIAFYNGEQTEKNHVLGRFSEVVKNYFSLMRYQKRLSWFVNGYGQTAIIIPVFLIAPQYFAGQILLGGIMQALMAFGKVQDAMSFFVDNYATIAKWQSIVNRLLGFGTHMETVEKIHGEMKLAPAGGQDLSLENIDVALPTGQVLLNKLTLRAKAGSSILISGPSGCGKSTLMRTLSGIWPFGKGTVAIPEGKRCFFLPQRPYLPLGTLRDALLYPERFTVTEEEVFRVLKACRIERWFDLLDVEDDWSRVLSLGEQQRMAFARVLLAKPDVLFMDESTSALDEATEEELYGKIKAELPKLILVSIGHRSTLCRYHDVRLSLYGDGRWDLSEIRG